MKMNSEMININANLVDDIRINTFTRDDEEVTVANFTLVKKYGDEKEYINCSVYGEKVDITKTFQKCDLIHVYGYYKEKREQLKQYKIKTLKKSGIKVSELRKM